MAKVDSVIYAGETLWPGILGHFIIILGFVSALLAGYALLKTVASQNNNKTFTAWKKIGTISFYIHGISVLSVISLLLFLLVNKYYEYNYVFDHANETLPIKYIFSAFWEGQEGSFLLWMFWHVILSFIMFSGKNHFKLPALGVMALIQAFLMSMLLGVYLGPEFKLGSNPFILVRDLFNAPIFAKADYLQLLPPMAKGLNPLLQNYWNIIHPPTMFLGFAGLSVPFCFGIAGLLKKDHKGWMKPAMPWVLSCASILGIGLLMGSAWAYEALSFGGYWAWDPVENSSLVPWLLLVAGLHTHLIAKNTGQSIRSTYIFYFLAFLMIVYSTTLTRSGILGDTSVHAFTEMGLEWQLLAFITFFAFLSIALMGKNWKSIPVTEKEEPLQSKEFWMFIGALVLLFSAFLINFTTSIPVYNKLLDVLGNLMGVENMAKYYKSTPLDPIPHYNKFQIWIAVFIGLLSGCAQFLRFKGLNWQHRKKVFTNKILIHTLIAIVFTFLTKMWIQVNAWQYIILLFSGWFTISSNLDYLITSLKGNLKIGASALSHVGFGLLIIGILASGLNQEIITKNVDFSDEDVKEFANEDLMDNVFLVKESPYYLGPFELTYLSDSMDGFDRYYHINIKRKNQQGAIKEEFNLYPSTIYDRTFKSVVSTNPAIRRYPHQDIFAIIYGLPPSHQGTEASQQAEDSIRYESYLTNLSDEIELSSVKVTIGNIINQVVHDEYNYQVGDLGVSLHAMVRDASGRTWHTYPSLLLRGNLLYNYPGHINELALRIKIDDGELENLFSLNQNIKFDTLEMQRGESINTSAGLLTFNDYNRSPDGKLFNQQEGDIAVSTLLDIKIDDQKVQLEPIYYIRDQGGFNVQAYDPIQHLVLRFIKLDPAKETITLLAGKKVLSDEQFKLMISENAPRDDYIVFQAKLFPGINLFWLGGIFMMLGLGLAIWRRIQESNR